jgi:cytochrome c553
MCISCHGVSGISSNQMWPNLAGQKRGYLIKALQDYKSGERKNAMMNSILKGLSEEDIQDISSYFSSLSESN